MQVHVCDKCGDITGLNHKVIFKEPIEGHTTEICFGGQKCKIKEAGGSCFL